MFSRRQYRARHRRRRPRQREFDLPLAEALSDQVLAQLAGERCPDVETIQDRVEETLAQAGRWRTARAYVVYREQHARLRDAAHDWVDVGQCMDEYLEQRDWRVNANANQGYSLAGWILNVAGKVTATTGWRYHPREAANAHRAGDIHIHDLTCCPITAPAGRCANC